MLLDEAKKIGELLGSLGPGNGRHCLNIGSSTAEFRQVIQPHIHDEVTGRLAANGWKVIHVDMKQDEGVDLVGDLMEPEFRQKLKGYDAGLLLCSNLLEHVPDPAVVIEACADVVAPGGYCLISVPRSYPYHPDPLDTLYRPSPTDLARLLPGWSVVAAEEVECGGLMDELRGRGRPLKQLLRLTARSLMPFYKPQKWKAAAHPLLWLVRRYKVSVVLLQKRLEADLPGSGRTEELAGLPA